MTCGKSSFISPTNRASHDTGLVRFLNNTTVYLLLSFSICFLPADLGLRLVALGVLYRQPGRAIRRFLPTEGNCPDAHGTRLFAPLKAFLEHPEIGCRSQKVKRDLQRKLRQIFINPKNLPKKRLTFLNIFYKQSDIYYRIMVGKTDKSLKKWL